MRTRKVKCTQATGRKALRDGTKYLGVDVRIILKYVLNGMVRCGVNSCSSRQEPVEVCCDGINIFCGQNAQVLSAKTCYRSSNHHD
jgi:hypothetical protein